MSHTETGSEETRETRSFILGKFSSEKKNECLIYSKSQSKPVNVGLFISFASLLNQIPSDKRQEAKSQDCCYPLRQPQGFGAIL